MSACRLPRLWLICLIPIAVAVAIAFAATMRTPDFALDALTELEASRVGVETAAFGFLSAAVPIIVALFGLGERRRGRFLLVVWAVIAIGLAFSLRRRQANVADMPHVLLLTLDGFTAERTALYGGARQTTPFLDEFAKEGLVAENFFPQACCTAPGLTAMMTGRPPLETGIFYPPHRLDVVDQHRNLAMIFAALGYRTIQLTDAQYADANHLGLRGFERVGGWERRPLRFVPRWVRPHLWLVDRVTEPFGVRPLAATKLGRPVEGPASTREKLTAVLEELGRASGPVFAQVHLVESHGPTFPVSQQHFSRGQAQTENWMPDFYDDMLREMDGELARFVASLEARGLGKRVLIVVSSDHASQWRVAERIPFVMRGPGVAPQTIRENAEPIDIAPTLLAVLGVPAPSWLQGRALVNRATIDPAHWLIATTIYGHAPEPTTGRWEILSMTPNRGLAHLDVIVCDKRFSLNLTNAKFVSETLVAKASTCSGVNVPSAEAIRATMLRLLERNGYTVAGEGRAAIAPY